MKVFVHKNRHRTRQHYGHGHRGANIIALGKSHQPRRAWVWAKLGQAPLAHAVKHLSSLAEATLEPLTLP